MRALWIGTLVAFAAAGVFWFMPAGNDISTGGQSAIDGVVIADVLLPESLSAQAEAGKTAFEAECAACHGINAAGQQDIAPPLVHVIYEPSHHGDEAFQRAVAFGVQGHHWPFGNMPAIEGLSRGQVGKIVAYIRELQRGNGIN